MICCKPDDDDVIQLSYHILLTTESLRELDNYYNIPKNGFTALGIIQLMKPVVIVNTPSLFDLLKAIGMTFVVGLCGLDIRY